MSLSKDTEWLRALRNDPCAYCGRKPSTEIDHIIPQSRKDNFRKRMGGNYAGICSYCNRSKGDLSLLMFLYKRMNIRKGWMSRKDV